jgi:hypothetical protein
VSLAYEGGKGCEEGCTQWAAAAALGDGRSPHPGMLAAALEFIHTNNSPNPILALLSGRFEARVYASEKGSRIQLKTPAGSRLGPLQHGLRGV